MDSLLKIFNEEEIANIMNINSGIKDVSNSHVDSLIKILDELGLNNKVLRNVVMSNPFYLTRDVDDILDLVNCLKEYRVKNINIILDTYPLFLNLYRSDIDLFIDIKSSEGMAIGDIIEIIESEPYVIDEIV